MANLNKSECNCMGIYNADVGGCDPVPQGVNPCPNFWDNVGSWDWNNISDTGLEWGYALGILDRPDNSLEIALYQQQLEEKRRQMNYIFLGLGILALIIVLMVLKKRK